MGSVLPSDTEVVLRAPSVSQAPASSAYKAPSLAFLGGRWHVTHSTLPMWKSKRNVSITYSALPPSSAATPQDQTDRLDDIVEYQSLDSEKLHTVHGVDKASGGAGTTDTWDWRGKGWLMIASSHWEVLGWADNGAGQDSWVVTYFAKTMFTPAGIDIYSRSGQGLKHETVEAIQSALGKIESEEFKALARELFEVKMDAARRD
ncbi:hypothetical protein MBLNU459_g2158t1 [Dothideomycetes sp. NU459]